MELAVPLVVGAPVPSPALVACPLFVHLKGAAVTAKGKGVGHRQPGIPGCASHYQSLFVPLLLIAQRIPPYARRGLYHSPSLRQTDCLPLLSIPEQDSICSEPCQYCS